MIYKANKNLIKFIICVVLCILCFVLALSCKNTLSENIPNAIKIYNTGFSVTISDLAKQNGNDAVFLAASHEQLLFVDPCTLGQNSPVKCNVITTCANYAKINSLNLIKGSYFYTLDFPSAVVSSKFAMSYFLTIEIIGKPIMIEDKAYTICGVYEDDNNLFYEISSSLYDNIYTSQCPTQFTTDCYPSYIFANKALSSSYEIINVLNHTYNTYINGEVVDYRLLHNFTASLFILALIACSLYFVCLMFNASYKKFMKLFSLPEDNASVLKLFIQFIAFMGLAIVLVWALLSLINIPPSYLPPDNIFDISFYRQSIVSFFTSLNSETSQFNYTSYLLSVLSVYIGLLFLGVVFFYHAIIIFFKHIFLCDF